MVIEGYLTTKEAAGILNLSRNRVLDLIRFDRLPAQKVGGIWLIKESDLELVKDRKPGRPRKQDKGSSNSGV
jgi:excisionase family DNA binding protein